MNDAAYTKENSIQQVPFFSIIIPVYNAACFLRECLRSILSQDFPDWEAVIVDDCSTDESLSIANEFAANDKRFRVFESPENSGSAYAPRIRAAKNARAKYLVVIDADDFVSADLLSSHYKMITLRNADLVIPQMWKPMDRTYKKILPVDTFDDSQVWLGKNLVVYTLVYWQIPMAGFAVNREIYLKADVRMSGQVDGSIFSDEVLSRWILYLCSGVAFTSSCYYYRHNSSSITNTNMIRFASSKLIAAHNLICMTKECFGESSSTYLKALENKFYTAVSCLRLANNQNLGNVESRHLEKMVADAMRDFPYKALKGHTSPRYLALMRLPERWARIALRLLDPVFNSSK